MSEALNDALAGAMRLLAVREHSQHELQRKLTQKGHEHDIVELVIAQLVEQDSQSDERFVEAFVNSHQARGKGPKRIQLELQQHQLAEHLVEQFLDSADEIWRESAAQVRSKKFGDEFPEDYTEKMKQAKFLEYRGFTHDQIFSVLKELE